MFKKMITVIKGFVLVIVIGVFLLVDWIVICLAFVDS